MSPEFLRAQRERRHQKGKRPDLLDVLGFGLPMVLPIALAVDGLAGTARVFYNPLFTFPIPWADPLQAFGIMLLFLAMPMLTSAAFLAAKYVYSKPEPDRRLLTRGPYRLVRHPIYLAFALTGVGFVLLAQNYLMLPVLILLHNWGWQKEEAELEQAYGERYTEYRARTGAFLPRIQRRR